jgi:uroporphyrinogen-III synthase
VEFSVAAPNGNDVVSGIACMCPQRATPAPSLRLARTGCATIPTLLGHTIALTGDRRAAELAAHLQALGAEVVHGPMVLVRPVSHDDRGLRSATHALLVDPPDYLLATTGIGVRGWVNAATAWRARTPLLDALAPARILARGPKVVGALSEVGLQAWHVAGSGRTSAMVDHLLSETSVAGAHVAIQLPGDPLEDAVERLEAAGARVTAVPVYEWTWPEDLEPARRVLRAIATGRASAVTFTSRPAVRHLAGLAAQEGLEDAVVRALRNDVAAICIGAATADALRALTGAEPCCPDRAVLGAMGPTVADELHRRGHHHLRLPDGSDVVVQRRLVDGNGISALTSDREAALLERLIGRPRRTVSRSELIRTVWRGEVVDASTLDATMARLRRRLGGTGVSIATVPGRGYLLNGELEPCDAGLAPAWDPDAATAGLASPA